MSWIPTEHGGYAMLLFPIASALTLPGAGRAAWALALAIIVLYLFHRVLLDLLGAAALARFARRHAAGQLGASLALASFSVPVALAAGASPAVAVTIALVWMLGFGVTALAVRAVIEHRCPERAARFVRAVLAGALIAVGTLAGLAHAGHVPAEAPLCVVPLAAFSCVLAVRPPSPRHMRLIGWALAVASCLTLGQLVIAL